MPEPNPSAEPTLLPRIRIGPDLDIRGYMRERLRQHTGDSYAGVPILKFPEDMGFYEHLLWLSGANTVTELRPSAEARASGFVTGCGRSPVSAGSPRRPSSRGHRHLRPESISRADRSFGVEIRLVDGDLHDPATARRVAALPPPGARPFVVEDSAHDHETTLQALRSFAGFVPRHGFMVVEDGVVDDEDLRVDDRWPRGVIPALHEWLADDGDGFRVRRDLELYGVTCHPEGFLQRVADARRAGADR